MTKYVLSCGTRKLVRSTCYSLSARRCISITEDNMMDGRARITSNNRRGIANAREGAGWGRVRRREGGREKARDFGKNDPSFTRVPTPIGARSAIASAIASALENRESREISVHGVRGRGSRMSPIVSPNRLQMPGRASVSAGEIRAVSGRLSRSLGS